MNKSEVIRIRISEREKQLIREASEKLNMSMSEYILYLIRKEADK